MLKKGKRYDVTLVDGSTKSINYGWLVKSVKGSLVEFETSDGDLIVNTQGPEFSTATLSRDQSGERPLLDMSAWLG